MMTQPKTESKTGPINHIVFYAAIALLAELFLPVHCLAQVSFQDLGSGDSGNLYSQATGVSADGTVVVGESNSASGVTAFRWEAATGMQSLNNSSFYRIAHATSADGNIVVGQSSDFRAFRFNVTIGVGTVLNSNVFPTPNYAYGVSADGAIVVGYWQSASVNEAFRWGNGTVQGLGDLPGGGFESKAYDTSEDGSIVVGYSFGASAVEAFRWDETGGMLGLGHLPGGSQFSIAFGVSADGNTVVGRDSGPSGIEAWIWDATDGMQGLGDLPGGGFQSWANATSADGNTVVGRGSSHSGTEAFVWDANLGMRSLKQVLQQDQGLDLTGWHLLEATDISDDGRVVVGYGYNPDFVIRAFRAELGPNNNGPTVTCPQSVTEECEEGGANVSIEADIYDADGDDLSIQWQITFADGSAATVNDTVSLGNPPVPVSIQLNDGTFFFPLGDSSVSLCVTDGVAEAECCSPITVRVQDTTNPTILTLIEQVSVTTDPGQCFATVDLDSETYAPEFSDLCHPDVTATNDAPSTFPVGETIVTWSINDGVGNTTYATQTIIVTDMEAPTVNPPNNVTVGHDSGACVATLVDLGTPDASDNCGVAHVTNDAPDAFPVGNTEVNWYISDAAGNTMIVPQTVTVTNAQPIAVVGEDLVLECESDDGREVTLDGTATSDPDSGDVLNYHWEAVDLIFDDPGSPTPTATFPLGSTTVQLTVEDQCGGTSTTDLLIIIQDTTAPQIQAVVVDQQVLWPPNHQMTPVNLDMLVSDTCTSPEDLQLICTVTSDQPDDENGDGAFNGDVDGQDGYSQAVEIPMAYNPASGHWEGELELRAERDGGSDGRKYSIRCAAMDGNGNVTLATVCVTVPKNRGGGNNN